MKRKRPVAVARWLLAAVVLAALGWLWFWIARTPNQDGKAVRKGEGISHGGTTILHMVKHTLPTTVLQSNVTSSIISSNRPAPRPKSGSARSAASNAIAHLRLSLTNAASTVNVPTNYPRPPQNAFELQIALARVGISSGSVDGRIGPQTRSALRSFQTREHLSETGEWDTATRERLSLDQPPTVRYVVTSNDLARLQPLQATWLGKSQQTALEYETLLEFLGEKGWAAPSLVRQLNPHVDWSNVTDCLEVELPNPRYPEPPIPAAFLTIALADKVLEAWDEQTNLLAHFPCSIARRVEKRPIGRLQVATIALHPNYTFDPENFPESAEAKELKTKLVLPPGPNNPVGTAWIGLDKAGYGIHGTPSPEQVGRTESHGCFRLANWNAEYLVRLVQIGTPVYVVP